MRLGVHVSIAGQLADAVDRAVALGCNTMQIFARNPRGWAVPPLPAAASDAFRRRRQAATLGPVVVHAPYLYNLASPEDRLWRDSIAQMATDVQRSDQFGADFYVLHLGSHRGEGEDAGVARVAEAVGRVLDGATPKLMLLLENSAGSGHCVGGRFEQIAAILATLQAPGRVGMCLDSAHTFTSGYDLRTPAGVATILNTLERTVGAERVKVVHLNDSKAAFASHVDRHWHIGEGQIGLAGLRAFVTHPLLRDKPFILETPKDSDAADPRNLATVRAFFKTAKQAAVP